MEFNFDFIRDTVLSVVSAIPMTLLLTLFPVIVGLVLGFVLALVRIRKIPVLSQLVSVYLSFFRSVPLLILLFLVYYGVPKLVNYIAFSGERVYSSANISGLVIALTTLTLYSGAFLCEIIRGALSSVDMRQMEAAHAIGMTKLSSYMRIIIPQTIIVALPNYFNFVLALLKGTSVVFTISVLDMMNVAKLAAETGHRFIEAYTMVGIAYILFSLIMSTIFHKIERNAKKHLGIEVN